ncbi:PfkB family carbohydrate kinase [Mycobacterium conspicuum]|jgi:ribokinase|uniref:Ribokinase n=1 Tax=Mycobacterium conspicuum TaxID=44010 RepID=A0A1X1SW62_9MYCO|nr:PfkB family carbohydrate kinase [Mycobacterium conspicuum]ORV35153.1 ribokinase [Mycobacterium conspicuum]BBZ42090.1 ribokinase [Mycobacterium conspicuum]
MSVVVIGQIGRDLVLRTDGPPASGESTKILRRDELLGGKGANQAVGLTQLGVPVALLGVVGDDIAGTMVLQQAKADGINTEGVVRRGTTALLIDIVGWGSERVLLEHVPQSSLVQVADLDRSAALLEAADTVSIQLQQPPATALAAASRARQQKVRVVADGAPPADIQAELLASVNVLRADAAEAALIAGADVTTVEQAESLGRTLLARGPELVALAVPGVGDLLVWGEDSQLFEFSAVQVVDPTGAGDAFTAGLIAALRDGDGPREAGRRAAAAASSTVQRLGGRPNLSGCR